MSYRRVIKQLSERGTSEERPKGERERAFWHGMSCIIAVRPVRFRLNSYLPILMPGIELTSQFASTHGHDAQLREVRCQIRRTLNVRVPSIAEMIAPPSSPRGSDPHVDWEENVVSLVEWVGMANLGSQRYLHTH